MKLVIVGAGDCGQALCQLALGCGWHVTVIDDRPGLLAACNAPVLHAGPAPRFILAREWLSNEALVLVRRDLEVDREALAAALSRPGAGYVGMMGSRGEVQQVFAGLRERGFQDSALARVYAPSGLDLGSESPQEIAVSILAEILQVLRHASGGSLRQSVAAGKFDGRESLQIRPATTDDIPTLIDLSQRIWWASYRGMIPEEQITYMLERMYAPDAIRAGMADGTHWELASVNGIAVGYLAWKPDPSDGSVFLDKLYLDSAFHGRGLGQLLLSHVRQQAERIGAVRVELRVNRRNERAMRAYRRAGFQIGHDLCQDIGNGFVMDDHVLILRLT